MPLFGNGVDKASRNLSALRDDRERMEAKVAALEQERVELRANAGHAALAAFTGDAATALSAKTQRARLATIEAELAALPAARAAMAECIRAARRDVAHARTEVLRGQTRKLQRELDTHEKRTRELLDALEQHAECTY